MDIISFFVLLVFSNHLFRLPLLASAQDAPVFIQGGFEEATVDDESVYNTGGTITVNGFNMIVPKNLQIQFPAAWVPWKDFVASKADFAGFETLVWIPLSTCMSISYSFFNLPGYGKHHQWRSPRGPGCHL